MVRNLTSIITASCCCYVLKSLNIPPFHTYVYCNISLYLINVLCVIPSLTAKFTWCVLYSSAVMYKRWIRRSTSTKRDSGVEDDDVSHTQGSIASSHSISPEEDTEEMVQVLQRVMNVVEFWVEHHYKVWCVGVACVVCGRGLWVWCVGLACGCGVACVGGARGCDRCE